MTTGRINQVATTQRFSFFKKKKLFWSSLVCVDCRLRPCISFAIVLYHCSAPASASRSKVELRRRQKSGLSCTSDTRFNLCSKLRRAALVGACNYWMDGWNNHWSIQLQKRVQVIQSSDDRHPMLKSKKRKASPKTRKSKICFVSPRSRNLQPREVYKARGEKHKNKIY